MPTSSVTYEAHIAYGGVISTDVLVTVTSRNACAKERVADTAVVDSGNATRDAEIGTSQLTPNPHPTRIATIRRPEYFTRFKLLGQEGEAPPAPSVTDTSSFRQ